MKPTFERGQGRSMDGEFCHMKTEMRREFGSQGLEVHSDWAASKDTS